MHLRNAWSLFPARLKATLAEAKASPAEGAPAPEAGLEAAAAARAQAGRIAVAAEQT